MANKLLLNCMQNKHFAVFWSATDDTPMELD